MLLDDWLRSVRRVLRPRPMAARRKRRCWRLATIESLERKLPLGDPFGLAAGLAGLAGGVLPALSTLDTSLPAEVSDTDEAAQRRWRDVQADHDPASGRRVGRERAEALARRDHRAALRDRGDDLTNAGSPLDVLPPELLADMLAFDLSPSADTGRFGRGLESGGFDGRGLGMSLGLPGRGISHPGVGAGQFSAGAPSAALASPGGLISGGAAPQAVGSGGTLPSAELSSDQFAGAGAQGGAGTIDVPSLSSGSVIAEFGGGGELPPPIVTIRTDDPSAFEMVADPGKFVVTRHDADLSVALVVNYTVSGTATPGLDYATLSGSVTIPADSSTACIEVNPFDDTDWEPPETVIVTLSTSSEYEIGWSDSATVTIYDDDFPLEPHFPEEDDPVVWIDGEPIVYENGQGGPGRLEVRREEESIGGDLTVYYTVTGTATEGEDYYALPGSITIPNGYVNAYIYIFPLDDDEVEVFESVIVTLDDHPSYRVSSFQRQAEAYIVDDPGADLNFFPAGPRVKLTIYNGQNAPKPVELSTSLGAFTVANMNDTDADGIPDNVDGDGVPGEIDFMKLIVHKPNPDNGGTAVLNVFPGDPERVRLWANSDRTDEIVYDDFGNVSFATADLDKTIWVELTSTSHALRDVKLTLSYQGQEFSVHATGLWATMTAFRNSGPESTAVAGNGNIITLADSSGFAGGNWLHVFDDGLWAHYVITGFGPGDNDLELGSVLVTTINGGEIVRQGYWREFDRDVSLISFENRDRSGVVVNGARLGIASHFYNSNAIRFMLQPPGVGHVMRFWPESGIVVDITRQKQERGWVYQTPVSGPALLANDPNFPAGDIPDDDGPNHFNQNPAQPAQQDEDTEPFVSVFGTVSDNVFVRDMPGWRHQNARLPNGTPLHRWVHRWNFLEFVRIKLDGTEFVNDPPNMQDAVEGSRASEKVPWNSRIDLINDGNGIWMRNPNAAANDNQIVQGHVALGEPP